MLDNIRTIKALLLCLTLGIASSADRALADTTLWRIGLKNDSASEFTGTAFPAEYQIPQDWPTRQVWPEFPPHCSGEPSQPSAKLDTTIHYSLATVPTHGELLRLKTVNASEYVTELAIFANGFPAGILQTIGTENGPDGLRFGNTYQLYIPPEFLHAGDNVLRIQKLGHPYNRADFIGLSLTLDWLELVQLADAPTEPIHSRYVRIGTNWGLFPVDDVTIALSR